VDDALPRDRVGLLDLGATPPAPRPFVVDARTTPRRLVWQVMRGAPRQTAVALPLLTTHQLAEAMVPIVAGLAVDRAIIPGDGAALVGWLAAIVLVFAVLASAWRLGSRVSLIGVELVQHRLRTQLTDRLLRRHPDAPRLAAGDGLSIATSDASRLAGAVSLLIMPLAEAAAVLLAAIVLLSISLPLGLLVLLGAIALLVGLDLSAGRLRDRMEEQQRLAGRAAASAADWIGGRRVLEGLGAARTAAERFAGVNRASLRASLRAGVAEAGYGAGAAVASGLFVVAVAALAGWLGLTGAITTGQLITAAGLAAFIMSPLGMLASNAGRVWAGAVASARRVLLVLAAAEREDGDELGAARTLELRTPAATVRLEAGELVGVVAPETEVAALLLALDGAPGAIEARVGGVPVTALHPDARPAGYGVSPHEAALFAGSLGEAIAPGDPRRAAEALHQAAADDLLDLLPEGLEQRIGDDAAELSGGQRQRVSLARAYASGAAVLVLEEPATAVDAVTELRIAERMRSARAGGTTLLLTASPPLLAICDRVVLLEDGAVRADGAHAELLSLDEYRQRLS